ncbi:hypothetical protein [Almyronema epifaneia]|uniref:Uncharacterized protein n=1 Tax=Almyronema epifaneia S1 TaxID=2991925 RepID=A0ABW6IAR6_9CYAN
MGLIQKIFGSIAAFFSSLLGVVGKVFGINKSGYFLELDDEDSGSNSQPAAQRPQKSAQSQPKVEPTALQAQGVEVFPAEAEVATKAALESNQAAASPEKLEKAAKQSASTSQDLANAGALPLAAAEAKGKSVGSEMTFATDYLVKPEVSSSRRRPGPSLTTFRNMAKTVKTPAA